MTSAKIARCLWTTSLCTLAASTCLSQGVPETGVPDDLHLKALKPTEWRFDGTNLVGARDHVAFLWDANSGQLIHRYEPGPYRHWVWAQSPRHSPVTAVAILTNPGRVITAGGSEVADEAGPASIALNLWTMGEPVVGRFELEASAWLDRFAHHYASVESIEVDGTGTRFLTFADSLAKWRLWSIDGPPGGWQSYVNLFIFKGDEVMFSPSGKVILDVADWRVLLWDAEDVRQLFLHEVAEGEAGIVTARICPLDERLLILTDDGKLSVRSIEEDAEVAAIEPGESEAVESEAGAVSGGDAGTGRQAGDTGVGRDFPGAQEAAEIQTIEFCRGGEEFLVVRAGGSLTLYDSATCETSHEFKFGGHIQKVTVSPDGNFACISMGRSAGGSAGGSQGRSQGGTQGGTAAGSQGGTPDEEISEYNLLDLQKRELVTTLPGRMVNSAGQDALRQLVGFSPHGDSILFVDSEGRTAELWDPASGYEIATVPLSYVSATAANYNCIVEGVAGK